MRQPISALTARARPCGQSRALCPAAARVRQRGGPQQLQHAHERLPLIGEVRVKLLAADFRRLADLPLAQAPVAPARGERGGRREDPRTLVIATTPGLDQHRAGAVRQTHTLDDRLRGGRLRATERPVHQLPPEPGQLALAADEQAPARQARHPGEDALPKQRRRRAQSSASAVQAGGEQQLETLAPGVHPLERARPGRERRQQQHARRRRLVKDRPRELHDHQAQPLARIAAVALRLPEAVKRDVRDLLEGRQEALMHATFEVPVQIARGDLRPLAQLAHRQRVIAMLGDGPHHRPAQPRTLAGNDLTGARATGAMTARVQVRIQRRGQRQAGRPRLRAPHSALLPCGWSLDLHDGQVIQQIACGRRRLSSTPLNVSN